MENHVSHVSPSVVPRGAHTTPDTLFILYPCDTQLFASVLRVLPKIPSTIRSVFRCNVMDEAAFLCEDDQFLIPRPEFNSSALVLSNNDDGAGEQE